MLTSISPRYIGAFTDWRTGAWDYPAYIARFMKDLILKKDLILMLGRALIPGKTSPLTGMCDAKPLAGLTSLLYVRGRFSICTPDCSAIESQSEVDSRYNRPKVVVARAGRLPDVESRGKSGAL